MESRRQKGAIGGALAPFVFLLSAVAISWLEEDFMGQLGWDEWPSGLALGPDGWLQIVNFIVLGLLLIAFAGAVAAVPARSRWARVAPVLLLIAGVAAVMLAFKEDPQSGDTTTWHGIIHVAAYFTWLLSLVLSYPFTWWRLRGGRLRKTARWPSALALLLFPPVLLLPDSGSAGNYLFFAVALTPLVAIASRMALSGKRVHPVSDDFAPRTRA